MCQIFSDSLDFQWAREVDIHFIFVQNGMAFIETSLWAHDIV